MLNQKRRVGLYGRVSGDNQSKEERSPASSKRSCSGSRTTAWNATLISISWMTATAGASWSARASNGSGTRPPPGASIASPTGRRPHADREIGLGPLGGLGNAQERRPQGDGRFRQDGRRHPKPKRLRPQRGRPEQPRHPASRVETSSDRGAGSIAVLLCPRQLSR